MKEVKLTVLDYVLIKINTGLKLIKPCISFESNYYIQKQFSKKRVGWRRSVIITDKKAKENFLPSGFLHRVKDYCRINNIALSIEDPLGCFNSPMLPEAEPEVPGLSTKEGKWSFQHDLIKKAIKSQRGVILSATASGKTIIMLGIISCYPSARVLFLSNSHTPISQFKESVKKYNFKDYNIHSFTIQSFYRRPPHEYSDEYDIVLIDEVHEGMSSFDGMYGKVLRYLTAPIRLGFTATLPDRDEAKLILEGLLGPVIGEFTLEEGRDRGVLAIPKIIIKKLPFNSNVRDMKRYSDAYKAGVVNNNSLNRMIVKDAKEDLEEGDVILILVREINHGYNIVQMAKNLYGFDWPFVYGDTDKDIREKIRHDMIDKNIRCIVASDVFKKALNIPPLSSIINARGGKGKSGLIQIIGRGSRIAEGKKYFKLRDYFNPSNTHLIKHFGYRVSLFFENKWL